MANNFEVTVLSDGKIVVNSPGGFSKETHADADDFLAMVKALAGGEVEVKQHKPNLADPHGMHQHGGNWHKH